jgi:hypothetical protein
MNLPAGKNQIMVYDLTGQFITKLTVSTQSFNFDMRKYSKGIYIFKVLNKNRMKVFKIIK